jgi:hypothetical protein
VEMVSNLRNTALRKGYRANKGVFGMRQGYKLAYQKEIAKNHELRKENERLKKILEKMLCCGKEVVRM